MYHEKLSLNEPSRTLKEQCILHICSNLKHFAQFGNFIHLPKVTKQEILDSLAKTQSVTLPILTLFRDTPISHLNLSTCGRVTNSWCTTLRDFPLTQLNLSHCLITDEALNIMRSKTFTPAPKKVKEEKSELVPEVSAKKKQTGKGRSRKYEVDTPPSSPPLQKPSPVKITWEISKFLTNLNMSFVGHLSTDGIDIIGNTFLSLKMLSLEGCPRINNDSLISIAKMTQLTAVNIKGCQKVTNKGINEIKRLTELEILNVANLPKITSESLNYALPYLLNLIYLNISNNEKLDLMDSLDSLTKLRTFDISNLNLTNLEFLKANQSITSLNLSKSNIEDTHLLSLQELENLKTLDLSLCKNLTPKGMIEGLKNLHQLMDLDISYTKCNSEVLKAICKFSLVCLNIRGCDQVFDSGFEAIGSVPTITHLNVSLMKTITEGWKFLNSTYQMLDIGGCIVEQNIEYFYDLLNHCNGLEAIYMTGNLLDDKICKLIAKMPLKLLDLSHTSITGDQLGLLSNITTMETLSLRECPLLKSTDYSPLSRYFRLVFLDLSNSLITDNDLSFITKCEDLCNLSLMNCKFITDMGMKHLLKLPRLNALNLYQVALTDGGMKTLRNLANVSTLRLSLWDLISDNGFDMLHELPNLVYLKTNVLNKTTGSYQV
jgi:hypothetical protein